MVFVCGGFLANQRFMFQDISNNYELDSLRVCKTVWTSRLWQKKKKKKKKRSCLYSRETVVKTGSEEGYFHRELQRVL